MASRLLVVGAMVCLNTVCPIDECSGINECFAFLRFPQITSASLTILRERCAYLICRLLLRIASWIFTGSFHMDRQVYSR